MSEKNDSIDKLVETYSKSEDEQKAYIKAQQTTIINQTKEINALKREIEKLAAENERILLENAQLKALSGGAKGDFSTTAEETICLVQLEMIKNMALTRELTLEETKKSEIFLKMLQSIRGKAAQQSEEEKVEKLSNEDLLKFMESLGPGSKEEQ
jgi:hypothetical protein